MRVQREFSARKTQNGTVSTRSVLHFIQEYSSFSTETCLNGRTQQLKHTPSICGQREMDVEEKRRKIFKEKRKYESYNLLYS